MPTLNHSPTESTASTSPSEQQYHHPTATPGKGPFTPLPTSLATQNLQQDSAHPQTLFHVGRQDSAISPQRIDIAKEAQQSSGPSSDFSYYHSHHHQAPQDSRQSISPSIHSQSASPISPHPKPTVPFSHPSHPHSAVYVSPRTKSRSPLATHPNPDVSRSHEYAIPPASVGQDQSITNSNNNTSSRQRYNVRFAANQTPDNMPSIPKPRQDRPPTPTTTETSDTQPSPKEEPTTPAIEPAIQIMTSISQIDDQPPTQARNREPSVERCSGCGETWRRPLPDKTFLDQNSSATTSGTAHMNPLALASSNLLSVLQQHGKKADAQYDKWKWEHSHCIHRGSSPYFATSGETLHSRTIDGNTQENGTVGSLSTKKRKNEHNGDDAHHNSKQRKVTFDSPTNAVPSHQPPTPT